MKKIIKRDGVKRQSTCPKCKRDGVNLYPYGLLGWRCRDCGGRPYYRFGSLREWDWGKNVN